jgi:hypothetical protein
LELNELEELNNVLSFSLKGGEDQIVLDPAAKIVSNQKNMEVSDSCEMIRKTEVDTTLDEIHRSSLGFDPSGGFNVSGDVEANVEVEDDLCKQDRSHFEVGTGFGCPSRPRPLKAKGCAEVKVVAKDKVAKKSVKLVKSTKKLTKKPTNKKSKEDK